MKCDPDELARAAVCLKEAGRLVAFTGAGCSAESGIPTFRDPGGLWSEFPPEEFGNLAGLAHIALREPRRLARFVQAVLEPVVAARPHAGHQALVELERITKTTVVTQNVDGLHQQAGNGRVLEVHGSLFEIVTRRGRPVRRLTRDDLAGVLEQVRAAACGQFPLPRSLWALRRLVKPTLDGFHRPNIVLFGEMMAEPAYSESLAAVEQCDCLLMIGTSGEVYPAALFPHQAQAAGAKVITIDPHPQLGDIRLSGTAATVLPRLLERVSAPPGAGEH